MPPGHACLVDVHGMPPRNTHRRVILHISTNHVSHVDESCHTYRRVTSHMSMSHVTRIHESCRTHRRVKSRMWPSHGIHIDESHDTHIAESCLVMSTRHVTYINEPRHVPPADTSSHVHERIMSCHICIYIYILTHSCDMQNT